MIRMLVSWSFVPMLGFGWQYVAVWFLALAPGVAQQQQNPMIGGLAVPLAVLAVWWLGWLALLPLALGFAAGWVASADRQ